MVKKGRKDKPDPRDTAPLIPREDQTPVNPPPSAAETEQPMMVALPMDEYSSMLKELDEKRAQDKELIVLLGITDDRTDSLLFRSKDLVASRTGKPVIVVEADSMQRLSEQDVKAMLSRAIPSQ